MLRSLYILFGDVSGAEITHCSFKTQVQQAKEKLEEQKLPNNLQPLVTFTPRVQWTSADTISEV